MTQPSPSRWPLAVGAFVGIAGLAYFLLVYGSRIDTMEGSAFMESAAPRRALPLGIATFLFALDFGRHWTGLRRVGFGVLVGAVVWAIAWQLLAYQARSPERRLRSIHSNAMRPNKPGCTEPRLRVAVACRDQWRVVGDSDRWAAFPYA